MLSRSILSDQVGLLESISFAIRTKSYHIMPHVLFWHKHVWAIIFHIFSNQTNSWTPIWMHVSFSFWHFRVRFPFGNNPCLRKYLFDYPRAYFLFTRSISLGEDFSVTHHFIHLIRFLCALLGLRRTVARSGGTPVHANLTLWPFCFETNFILPPLRSDGKERIVRACGQWIESE